jgi:hypothetical protein
MANKPRHRRFGNIRKRDSGRYQIRYPGPDGRMRAGSAAACSQTHGDHGQSHDGDQWAQHRP